MEKIGILTGGGDAPGLNGVIRGAVLTCLHNGIEIVGIRDGFGGFARDDGIVPLDRSSVRGILWRDSRFEPPAGQQAFCRAADVSRNPRD